MNKYTVKKRARIENTDSTKQNSTDGIYDLHPTETANPYELIFWWMIPFGVQMVLD